MVERYKNQTGTKVVSNTQTTLSAVGNIDLSQSTFHVGDVITIPSLEDCDGIVMSREFNGSPVYFIVTEGKLLYFSTLRKSVTHYVRTEDGFETAEMGEDVGGEKFYDDGHIAHSKGDFYDQVMAAPTLWGILQVIAGHKIKVTDVLRVTDSPRFARDAMGNSVVMGLRNTTIPHFEFAD